MKTVKQSDFDKYGCIQCGCEYCYCDNFYGSAMDVICGECHKEFRVVHDSLKVTNGLGFVKEYFDGFIIPEQALNKNAYVIDFFSSIDFSNPEVQQKLANGLGIEKNGWIYSVVSPHPREGIPKHKFMVPDIRPADGKGDYCYPRGVGYDLACFVKSKEAGERITEMINRVNIDYENQGFRCHLDYRENEPLWIQVKIDYPNKLRAYYLQDLITENDNIITEELVRIAMNQKFIDLSKKYINDEKVFRK